VPRRTASARRARGGWADGTPPSRAADFVGVPSVKRRTISVFGAAGLVLLLGTLTALWPHEPVYSVSAVTAGLRHDPAQWVGRTISVRGLLVLGGISVPFGFGGSTLPQGALLLDNFPFMPGVRLPFRSDAAGQLHLNEPQTQPALFIKGPVPFPRSPRSDPVRTFMHIIAEWAAHPNAVGPDDPRQVYRAFLLPPGRCLAPIASPCLSGTLR